MSKIKIDIQRFVDSLQKDESGYIFSEEDVFRFIVDALNEAGIDAELKYQDTDFRIVVQGMRAFVTTWTEQPTHSLVQAVKNLSDEINSSKTLASWYSYSKGEHFINFEEKKQEEETAQAVSS